MLLFSPQGQPQKLSFQEPIHSYLPLIFASPKSIRSFLQLTSSKCQYQLRRLKEKFSPLLIGSWWFLFALAIFVILLEGIKLRPQGERVLIVRLVVVECVQNIFEGLIFAPWFHHFEFLYWVFDRDYILVDSFLLPQHINYDLLEIFCHSGVLKRPKWQIISRGP